MRYFVTRSRIRELNAGYLDSTSPIELHSGPWILRLLVNLVETAAVVNEEAPAVTINATCSPLTRASQANMSLVKEDELLDTVKAPSRPSESASNVDKASTAHETAIDAESAESKSLDAGADVARTKINVAEASTSLTNIASGPSIYQPFPVNNTVLSSIVSPKGSWSLLSERLATLLGVADQIAEVCLSFDTSQGKLLILSIRTVDTSMGQAGLGSDIRAAQSW